MTLLIPLGLLGLISIAALILIYIIKPNYLQKTVSSTFVWKLSLKYKKKRIPLNKLFNIILLICQILVLVFLALIIAQPAKVLKKQTTEVEVIAIIDSSASMRVQTNDVTRFERAIEQTSELAQDTFGQGGLVSVILAEPTPSIIAERIGFASMTQLEESLKKLVGEDISCSYGSADLDGAITLSEDILAENPNAKIYVYTDTTFAYVPENVTIVNVGEEEEWNVGILDVRAEVVDNYYVFSVDVASYGRDIDVEIKLTVSGANASEKANGELDEGLRYEYKFTVQCNGDETQTVVFSNGGQDEADLKLENVSYYTIADNERVYSFRSVEVSVNEDDNFNEDDHFFLYGGEKPIIKVMYSSSNPNKFMTSALDILRANSAKWDVRVSEFGEQKEPPISGYDFYIYEHRMPKEMPLDGVVMLMDPNQAPSGAGFRVGSVMDYARVNVPLVEEASHEILNFVKASDITVSRFTKLTVTDSGYSVLMSCDGSPMLLLNNTESTKTIVMSFNIHYSNLAVLYSFPVLMYNIFQYFFPTTVSENAFEVYQSTTVNAMGESLNIKNDSGYDFSMTVTEFPSKITFSVPGTYSLTQETYYGKTYREEVYVKIPSYESDIWKKEDSLKNPYSEKKDDGFFQDLILYFAIALVTLLFAEWILQSRENM